MDTLQLAEEASRIIGEIRQYVLTETEELPVKTTLSKVDELETCLQSYLTQISRSKIKGNQVALRDIISEHVKLIDKINYELEGNLIETFERNEIAALFTNAAYLAGFIPSEQEYQDRTNLEESWNSALDLPFDRAAFDTELRSRAFDVTFTDREHW